MTSIIVLKISDALKNEKIVTNFLARTGNGVGFIEVELNHIYDNKKIVSDISTSWDRTLSLFSKRATEKNIQERHIQMIKDSLDDNSDKIINNFYFDKAEPNGNGNRSGAEGAKNNAQAQRIGIAFGIINRMKVQVFPDEVRAPYIAIRVNDHVETMSIMNQTFEDWLGSTYYENCKQQKLEELRREMDFRYEIYRICCLCLSSRHM